jgi:hypothetical protein
LTNSERNADNLNDGMRHVAGMKTILASILLLAPTLQAADQMANPLIDYRRFQQIARETEPLREKRRVTETQFAALAAESGQFVLDARSADKFALRHIRGAVSLPFTDFTAESLARVIPTKTTRVLIYCNNNFVGAPRSLASKAAPASLNISTYIALATYGYTNVFRTRSDARRDEDEAAIRGTEVTGPK